MAAALEMTKLASVMAKVCQSEEDWKKGKKEREVEKVGGRTYKATKTLLAVQRHPASRGRREGFERDTRRCGRVELAVRAKVVRERRR
jgi:hypothetical protein